MRAVVYHRFGPPEVLGLCELDTPIPGPEEVRIRVRATTVTAAESAMRRGEPLWGRILIGFLGPRRRFRILGTELSGEIDAVGERVTRFSPGEEVSGFAGFRIGANADYICLPQTASLAPKPRNKSHEEAAAAVDGASTALHFLRDRARLQPGQHVLIVGASGSIGTYAVQLAKHLGAEVTGVCSTRNLELVRSLGADHVIDYTRQDPGRGEGAYDVVFDTVGKASFRACRRVMRPGSVYLSTVPTLGNVLQQLWTPWLGTRRVVGGMSIEKREALLYLRELIEADELQIVIDRRYPLESIVEAHRYVDGGHKRGNVVISLG